MAFFKAIWESIKKLFAALTPFSKSGGLTPVVRWIIWIVLDVTVLVILYFINARWTELPGWLPDLGPSLRNWWLPALGQLVILMIVVLYWFYVLWFTEADDSPFPDIDAAWSEGVLALTRAQISLTNVPLFLILGRPGTSEARLFEASGMKLVVPQTPADPRAPVHFFAEKNAVYVTCRGASVLGKLAGILAREETAKPVQAGPDIGSSANAGATEVPWKREDLMIQQRVSATEGREATTLEKRILYRLSLGKPLGSDLLSDAREVARHKARLAHLCHLMARDRQPHCAANGLLMLIPLGGTDTPGEAAVTAQACHEDLQTARNEMKIDCPLLTLLVDMEDLPGFGDFIQLQSPAKLRSRRGSGFPMSTRRARPELMNDIRKSLIWVCTTYMQDSVYKCYQSETPADKEGAPFYPGNERLTLLLAEMNDRADALSTIILQAVAPEHQPEFRYTGFYFAATGGPGNQAFVADAFQKMAKEQSAVTWTQAAKEDDAQCHAWASYYFITACVLFLLWVLGLAAVIALMMRR